MYNFDFYLVSRIFIFLFLQVILQDLSSKSGSPISKVVHAMLEKFLINRFALFVKSSYHLLFWFSNGTFT